MKLNIKKSVFGLSIFLLAGFGLVISGAHASGRVGASCLEHYDGKINAELYVPGTQTGRALGDIYECATMKGDYAQSLGLMLVPAMVVKAPFQIAVGLCQTVKVPFDAIKKRVRESRYGDTYALMLDLQILKDKIIKHKGDFTFNGSRAFFENLAGVNLVEYKKYYELISSQPFSNLARSQGIEKERYPVLVESLLYQYLYGDLFCGESYSDPRMITIDQLVREHRLVQSFADVPPVLLD